MNNLSATGNIGRDAETRFTPNGKAITSFSLAITSGFGENKNTTWLNCSYWGERGEKVAPYLKKGTQIGVNGALQVREYDAKDGTKKQSVDLVLSDITLLGGKGDNITPSQDNAPQSQSAPTGAGNFDDFENSIPF